MTPGLPKTDIDSYFDQTKPQIKTLIENQLKKMGSAKVIMTLWVIWRKPVKLLIGPENLDHVQDKGRPLPLLSPSPQEMDEFEKEEMKKSRSLVKNKLNEWYDCLIDHVPKPIKNTTSKKFLELKNSNITFYDGVKKTLNGQTKDNLAHENEEGNGYKRTEMPFNSVMTEFFEGSDINDLIQCMLAYIKAQTENPKFPESGFILDKIMHLYTNFHKLALTRGSSYIELPEWIESKKVVINP